MRRLSARAAMVVLGIALGGAVQAEPAAGAIVVVVSPANPIAKLTRNQVADLFLGKSQQFPSGARAVPIDQAAGSAQREQFYATVLGRTATQVRAHWSKVLFTGRGRPPPELADDQAVKQAVAADPRAIGYIDRRRVDQTVVVVLE